jgi:hypothetical protein
MFYLHTTTEPQTADELATALESAVRQTVHLPAGQKLVTWAGQFPALDSFTIDLTGGQLDPRAAPPKPQGMGQNRLAFYAKALRVVAHPILVDSAPVHLDLHARDAQMNYDRTSEGQLLLMPGKWAGGELAVEIALPDLQSLLLRQAGPLAEGKGVEITKVDLNLRRLSERSAALEARITARKGFLTGVIQISGQLDIDSAMRARLSNLDCRGENLTGNLAAGLLRPKLQHFNGREFSLGEFIIAGMKVEDVKLASIDPLRVTATFSGS